MIENFQLVQSVFGEYLEASQLHHICSLLKVKKYAANTCIVSKGELERYFYLVKSGVQMLCTSNQNGDKVVLGFSFSPSPSGVYDSFVTCKPSSLFFETLTDSELLLLNRRDFENLSNDPGFIHWRASFAEHVLFGRLKRELEITTLSAKERFDAFAQRRPDALINIPQKYIASYLNMTPETFSRLRAERY